MKVILGTGQLGLALLAALLEDNPAEPITLVNRTGRLDFALPDNVQLRAVDVTNPQALENLAQTASVLFSCTDVPYHLWGEFYPAAAAALAHTLRLTDARLVFADNLYSYGNVAGAVQHEALPHWAQTRKGRIRAAVLRALQESDPAIRAKVAVVKAADFIGPGIHKGVFGTDFLDRLHHGKTISLFGKLALPHTFTYIGDLARAMRTVGNTPDAFGQTWHVPNSPPLSLAAWVRLFEAETGKKARILRLPKGLVWLAGRFDPLARELYELAYQFEHPYLVDHSKYARRFGEVYTEPESIVRATVQAYAARHQQ